jgi:hypothetical protein
MACHYGQSTLSATCDVWANEADTANDKSGGITALLFRITSPSGQTFDHTTTAGGVPESAYNYGWTQPLRLGDPATPGPAGRWLMTAWGRNMSITTTIDLR